MGRVSKKENKSIYQVLRESKGWSRERASQELVTIPPERIERIESGKFTAHPDEVLLMADVYDTPSLANVYCARECEIGRRYVPELKMKDLSQIVLEMLASLNSVQQKQNLLIQIASDGVIENHELDDFLTIMESMDKISITIETLKLWAEQKVADGGIDEEAYKAAKAKRSAEK